MRYHARQPRTHSKCAFHSEACFFFHRFVSIADTADNRSYPVVSITLESDNLFLNWSARCLTHSRMATHTLTSGERLTFGCRRCIRAERSLRTVKTSISGTNGVFECVIHCSLVPKEIRMHFYEFHSEKFITLSAGSVRVCHCTWACMSGD